MSGVAIVGIGIHRFGRTPGVSGRHQGAAAARMALADAGIDWRDVQCAFGGSEDGGNADAMVADLGLTGIPFVNVRNGCATAGSALSTAAQAIDAGACDVAMAIGFDKHPPGAFSIDPEQYSLGSWYGATGLMLSTQYFAMRIQRYAHEHGISTSTLALVAEKAFANGAANESAWRRDPLNAAQILGSPMVNDPLTKFMFCSPGEGGVAAVLTRAELVHRYPHKPVYVRSAVLRTRSFGSFDVFSPSLAIEPSSSPTIAAAATAFEMAGVAPGDVDVAQVQDTDAGSEVIHMAECGLCEHGEQENLIKRGATLIGGSLPVNTDGGCLANGEPVGASGLRQVHECVRQLRDEAGRNQVPGSPRVAFTHVYGAPGLSACTVLTT